MRGAVTKAGVLSGGCPPKDSNCGNRCILNIAEDYMAHICCNIHESIDVFPGAFSVTRLDATITTLMQR